MTDIGIGGLRLTAGTEQDRARTPLISLVLAYAAMLPLAAGAIAAAASPRGHTRSEVEYLATNWAGAVLCFLAGVRRGLSFREPGGSTVSAVGEMFLVFTVGAGSLLLPGGRLRPALLAAGFGVTAVSDIRASGRGEAPRYFARLRPAQMMVPIASLVVLLATRSRDRAVVDPSP